MEANSEETNGIKFTWNCFPSNRADSAAITIPVGFHYTPESDQKQFKSLNTIQCYVLNAKQYETHISLLT